MFDFKMSTLGVVFCDVYWFRVVEFLEVEFYVESMVVFVVFCAVLVLDLAFPNWIFVF